MGKEQKPAGEDNDFFDDVDEDLVETGKEPEKESGNDEDKFFTPEPDEKGENTELDTFFDEGNGEKPLLSDEFEESEEEKLRKKKTAKRAVVISACSVFVVAVCVFAFILVSRYNDKFIMKFDGKNISVEEYKLFYYISQEEDPKNAAMDSLQERIAIENWAKANNITLTDEEKSETAANAQEWKESFTTSGYDMPAISDERLAEMIGVDMLYTKLYDLLSAGYTVDDSDFAEQYEDFVTNYKPYYIDAQYRYIMAETEENALKAKEMIESGEDLNDVMAECAVDYVEGDEVQVLGIYEISYYFTEEDVEYLLTLSAGQVSDVIEFSGVYYMVFVMDYIEIPTDEENRASFTEMYYDSKKQYIFLDELEAFRNAADIKVYEKVFDKFS